MFIMLPTPITLVTLRPPSTLTYASGFYSAGDSLTSFYFCYVFDQVPTANPPLSLSNHSPDCGSVLPDHVKHRGCPRGLAVVAFWPSFAVPHLAGRTDVLPLSDHDVADVGSPGP